MLKHLDVNFFNKFANSHSITCSLLSYDDVEFDYSCRQYTAAYTNFTVLVYLKAEQSIVFNSWNYKQEKLFKLG